MTKAERMAMNPGRAAREAARADRPEQWTPPVLRTVAVKNEGIDELVAALDRHFAYLAGSGVLSERRRSRLRERVVDVVSERVRTRLWRDAATNRWLDEQLPSLEAGATNPFDVADALLVRSGNLLTQAHR
jgi:LAO/AO transport system kinase